MGSFDIDAFTCKKLENHAFQLGIILYPTDLINEKFLISVRDCVLKLADTHPVKQWLKTQSSPIKPDAKEQEKIDFLTEILNTQFNLLTEQKTKNKVIALLAEIPDGTTVEKILKSYLYLMIGNITRSDRILKNIIEEPPRFFYRGYALQQSLYHRITLQYLERVLQKFGRHPADRLTFSLLQNYLMSFANKEDLLEMVDDIEPKGVTGKMNLAYTERIAPELVGFVRLSRMSEKRRIRNLRDGKYSQEMQSFWVWPFLDVSPLISELMVNEVKLLDGTDPLWAIYVLDDERLADLYYKKGGTPVARRRSFLRKHLQEKDDYMLTLFKLIEIGDIDQDLVQNVSQFLKR